MKKNPKAFVLMPFEPEFNSIWDDLIRPALEDVGYDAVRADSLLDQQNILGEIVRGIAGADLVVVDLTTLNANVLYELGLCHGLRIPTILLAQSMEEVPFDLRAYRIQLYSTGFDKVDRLKQALREIGEKHKVGEITFGSPVTDFLPEDYSPAKEVPKICAEEPVEEVLEEVEEEKGFLDFMVESVEASEEMSGILSGFMEKSVEMSEGVEGHAERLVLLCEMLGPGGAGQVHRITSLVVRDMTWYSAGIEASLAEFENCSDVLGESWLGIMRWMRAKTEEERAQLGGFRQAVGELLEGTTYALERMLRVRDAVASMEGISREINRAKRRLTGSLGRVISILEKVEAFCARTVYLIDETLEEGLISDVAE